MTLPDVCEVIDRELAAYSGRTFSPIEGHRLIRFQQLSELLRVAGFPRTTGERYETSLYPYFFQEPVHDDLDPWSRQGDLGQLIGP
jgi:hypothetical protein